MLILLSVSLPSSADRRGYGDPVPNPSETCALKSAERDGPPETFCSATLIDNGFLVTAAHCFLTFDYKAKMDPLLEKGKILASCPNPLGPEKLPPIEIPIKKDGVELMRGYYGEDWKQFDELYEKTYERKKKEILDEYGKMPTAALEELDIAVMQDAEVKVRFEALSEADNPLDAAILRFDPVASLLPAKKVGLGLAKEEAEKLLQAGKCVVSGYGASDPSKERGNDLEEGVNVGKQFTFAASKAFHFGTEFFSGLLFMPLDEITVTKQVKVLGLPVETTTIEVYNAVLAGDSGGSVRCEDEKGAPVLIAVIFGQSESAKYCVSGKCENQMVLLGDTLPGKWVVERYAHALPDLQAAQVKLKPIPQVTVGPAKKTKKK